MGDLAKTQDTPAGDYSLEGDCISCVFLCASLPLPPDPSESGLLSPQAVEWKFVVLLRWILGFKQAMRLQRRLVRSICSQEKRVRQSAQRPITLSTERTAARARGNSPEPPRGPMVGVEHANA